MSSALELKQQGNAAFVAKKYDEAIALYDRALAVDAQNVDLYNNRSACNHALKRYDVAIADARKGLNITQSAKGYCRLGAALWSSGRLEEAAVEYERAQALSGDDATIQENLTQLRTAINARRSDFSGHGSSASGAGGSGGSGATAASPQALLADAVGVVGGVAYLIGSFISPALLAYAWNILLFTMIGRQAITLFHQGMFKYSSDVLARWTKSFAPLYFLICAVAVATRVAPQMPLAISIAIFCFVDLVDNRQMLQSLAAPIYPMLAPRLEAAAANRQMFVVYACTCESMLLFIVMFSGGIFFTMAYIQFVKMRYLSDPLIRTSFSAMRMNISRLTRHSMCPPVVDRGFQKFCDLLHSMSQTNA